ncbi:MAG: hypothetical protein ABIK83_14090 [Candidatus Zixiibacteriota bacterium]
MGASDKAWSSLELIADQVLQAYYPDDDGDPGRGGELSLALKALRSAMVAMGEEPAELPERANRRLLAALWTVLEMLHDELSAMADELYGGGRRLEAERLRRLVGLLDP